MLALPFAALASVLLLTTAAPSAALPVDKGAGCGGQGALSARLNGAVERDISWTDRSMRCEGSVRPDGTGLRLTAVGPLPGAKHELRILLGIAGAKPGVDGANLAANLTLIVGKPGRIYATRGGDKCTVDVLRQRRQLNPTAGTRAWQVTARGFCIAPAATLDGRSRILLSRFDLQTELVVDD
jgi:hypothetical protein